jgi:hypothetical protein
VYGTDRHSSIGGTPADGNVLLQRRESIETENIIARSSKEIKTAPPGKENEKWNQKLKLK